MMTKKQAKDFLVDYLNGYGSEEERTALAEWLEKDSELRNEAEMISNEMNMLKGMLEDPIEDARLTAVTERVMSKVRDSRNKSLTLLSPAWRSYLKGAAIAALAVVIIVVVYFITPGSFVSNNSPALDFGDQSESYEKPTTVKLVLTTENPKVKIYWTLSDDFQPLREGE